MISEYSNMHSYDAFFERTHLSLYPIFRRFGIKGQMCPLTISMERGSVKLQIEASQFGAC